MIRIFGKAIALGPELLGCSIVKKLEVSLKYFVSLGIHSWQFGEMFANFPMLFSWWPNNYQGIRYWLGSRSNLKLCYMLACTDEEFNKKVEAIVKRCQRFEAGLLEGISLINRQLMTLWRLRSFLKMSQHSNSIRLKSILLALSDWVLR